MANDMSTYFKILEASRISQLRHKQNRDSSIVCFVGEPGIGKTQTVEAYAKSINYSVDSMVLGRSTPVDFGIPAPDKERDELVLYVTKRFLEFKEDGVHDGKIMFFDDVGSATQETQVAIQCLIQDRVFEGRPVDDRIMFVMATNLPEHTGGANDLIKSLASRLLFVHYKFDMKTWFKLARTKWDIVPEVYSFNLWKEGSALHMFDPSSKSLSNPDPRGWNKLSHTLMAAMEVCGADSVSSMYESDPDLVRLIVEGQIGEGISHEFCGFIKMAGELPTVSEIFDAPAIARIPEHSHAQYAIIFNVEQALAKQEERSKIGRADRANVDATYEYIERLPKPMAVLAFRRLSENVKSFVITSKHASFTKKFESILNIK